MFHVLTREIPPSRYSETLRRRWRRYSRLRFGERLISASGGLGQSSIALSLQRGGGNSTVSFAPSRQGGGGVRSSTNVPVGTTDGGGGGSIFPFDTIGISKYYLSRRHPTYPFLETTLRRYVPLPYETEKLPTEDRARHARGGTLMSHLDGAASVELYSSYFSFLEGHCVHSFVSCSSQEEGWRPYTRTIGYTCQQQTTCSQATSDHVMFNTMPYPPLNVTCMKRHLLGII